jgi:AraC-like DNA-binding protein
MQRRSDTKVFAQPPTEALRPFVKRFLVIEFPEAQADSHLPGTGVVAAFPFRGFCRLDDGRTVPHAALTGLHDRVRHHEHSPGNAIVLAQFTPAGASTFFRYPLDELANTTVRLDELFNNSASTARLEEQLASTPNHFRRVQLVESFLLVRTTHPQPDPLVAAAVRWIEQAPPETRIKDLVRHIGLSQSALERRFRHHVGTTPKKFAALVRLQRVLSLQACGDNLSAIAQVAGYHDQAHFTHDFKYMTGHAPGEYFARAAS